MISMPRSSPLRRSLFLIGAFLALSFASTGCAEENLADDGAGASDGLHSAASVTLTGTASPGTVLRGQEVTISLSLTSTRSTTVDLRMEVKAPSGATAYTAAFPGIALKAGVPATVEEALVVDTSDPEGTYTVSVTAIRSGSTTVLGSNASAAVYTVGAATVDVTPVTATRVTIGNASHSIDGINVPRLENQLVIYTRTATQTVTPTNIWGAEAVVVGGKVVSITDRQATGGPAVTIPADGYVLSGHNTSRDWLLANAVVGANVVLASDATAPAPTPQPSTSALPDKVLGLYFFMYNSPRLATIQAQAPQYNVVYYAFALGTNNGGTVSFSVPAAAGGEANFKTDASAWRASGRKAILSVGGGSDTGLRLLDASQAAQFMASITPVIDAYGFQGIDWDIEQSSAYNVATIVSISRQLKAKYGPQFILSIVPRPYEFRSTAPSHPYRDIALQLGSDLDLIGFQFYDYPESKDATQQMTIIQNDILDAVKDFPSRKLLIGAEAPNAGLAWSPASVYRDAYVKMNAATPGLRGAFIWDSPNEQASGWTFAKTMGPVLQ